MHTVALQTGAGWGQSCVSVSVVSVEEQVPWMVLPGDAGMTTVHCVLAPSTVRPRVYVPAAHALLADWRVMRVWSQAT